MDTNYLIERDAKYWEKIQEVIDDNNLSIKFISEHMNSFVMRRDSAQYLAYFEIFQQVKELPGCFAEFGIYWGSGFFTWLNLLELFIPLDRGRKLFGFEDFSGYEREIETFEENSVKFINERRGGDFKSPADAIKKLIEIKNSDNLVAGNERAILYEGNIQDIWDDFRNDNPGVRFSLACIDFNLYKPTSFILKKISELIVKGGILVLRGYGVKPWEGESRAVDEFFENSNYKFTMKNIIYNNTPGAYLIKQ